MMESTELQGQPADPVAQAGRDEACCTTQPKRSRLSRWLLGGAIAGLALALYAGWDWLVAAGLATTVIALAPCVVMCALGLCMGRGRKP
jgi:hypothetical protein